MAEVIKMPKMSDTMTEGVVAKWHKKVGDKVKSGDLLADIETDKATMEFESYQDGVLLYIGVEEGKGAPVDSVLAILGKGDEDVKAVLASIGSGGDKPEAVGSKQEAVGSGQKAEGSKPASAEAAAGETRNKEQETSNTKPETDGRIKASPLAK